MPSFVETGEKNHYAPQNAPLAKFYSYIDCVYIAREHYQSDTSLKGVTYLYMNAISLLSTIAPSQIKK